MTKNPVLMKHRLHQGVVLNLLIIPLAATLFAFTVGLGWVSGKDLILFGSFSFAVGLGVTVGYHRMLTHYSFNTNPIIKGILLILGVWSLEGTPISWAATHLAHHANADKDTDPHSPMKSLWHAHAGWLFVNRKIDSTIYAQRQLNDPVVMFITKTTAFWAFLGLFLPFLLGGWSGFIWAGLVRVFVVHHITWSVNSLGHSFGKQDFNKGRDLSTNSWLVGILALGEGWHNNHHAFPKSAFHGLKWYQIDISGKFIRTLEFLHLANDVCRVPKQAIVAKQTAASKKGVEART